MTIGNIIKERRKFLKMSADDLATKLNKNKATIYRYENGDIQNLPINILEPISKILETTPAYLMGWKTTLGDTLSDHEKNVITAYREHPEMQNAIDTLLKISK